MQNQIQKEIIIKRANDVENLIEGIYSYYSNIRFRLNFNDKEFYNYIVDLPFQCLPNLIENIHLIYSVDYFNDDKLTNYFEAFVDAFIKFTKIFKEFSSKVVKGDDFDNEYYRKIVYELDIDNLLVNIFWRLDDIRKSQMIL